MKGTNGSCIHKIVVRRSANWNRYYVNPISNGIIECCKNISIITTKIPTYFVHSNTCWWKPSSCCSQTKTLYAGLAHQVPSCYWCNMCSMAIWISWRLKIFFLKMSSTMVIFCSNDFTVLIVTTFVSCTFDFVLCTTFFINFFPTY